LYFAHIDTRAPIHTQLKILGNFAAEQITGRQLAFEPELMTIRTTLAKIYEVGLRF
jgi:hypothetical protein